MYERTIKYLTALFDETEQLPEQITTADLYDYADALLNDEDVATLFPRQHQYVTQMGAQDAYYQSVLTLVQKAKTDEQPPRIARFDFSYLPSPVNNPWRIELGQLIINLTAQVLSLLAPTPALQVAYLKSADEAPLFALAIEDTKGVTVQVMGRGKADAATCTLLVGVAIGTRTWPRLGGIPITVTTAGHPLAQVTDTFGCAQFHAVARTDLLGATIAIGPLPELQAGTIEPQTKGS